MRPEAVWTLRWGWRWLVRVHESPLPRRRRGRVRFLELLRTLVAAHFDDLAAELDLDGIFIQLAIASRAGFLFHDIALQ